MDIKEKQARWALEKPLFETEFIHSHLLPFFNFNENTGDYEIKSECVNNTDDEDRKVAYETLNTGWVMWLRAKRDVKAQEVPEGFVLMPKEPTYKMWGGIARHLCRYAQMHDRYSPKSLKKYFDMFIGDTPAWLNAEVSDWESDHAFATADIGVFIYKAMIEAQHPSSTSDCPDEP